MNSIPASAIVQITPAVLSAGGTALDLQGLLLTQNTRVPIGEVLEFTSSAAITDYFGGETDESNAGDIYFAGFDNSTKKPGSVLFMQYNEADVAAYLRGGDLSTMTLAELQALTGSLTVTFDGTGNTSSAIDLSEVTSFSNAATVIEAAFTIPTFSVSYDSVSGGFIFLADSVGVESTIVEITGTMSAGLKLTVATGAVLSQGADATTPSLAMNAAVNRTTNWATFATLFDPDSSGNTEKLLFAAWTATKNQRYAYICWDTDVTPKQSTAATTSMGYILADSNSSGICLISAPDYEKAVMICGFTAAIDFEETNGRINFAFKRQSGQAADVVDETEHNNLLANGYNFYGKYATGNDQFIWLYNGSISGQYKWLNTYINQIWLNNAFQLSLMSMLDNMKSVPYNDSGYAMIRSWMMDPINAALNFGAVRPGVSLSAGQISAVNTGAGKAIDSILSAQGWYLQIIDATAQVRGNRGTPPIKFWYMDGGDVNEINVASIEVQ